MFCTSSSARRADVHARMTAEIDEGDMATKRHDATILTSQTPGGAVHTVLVKLDCRTAAEVRARAAHVRAFRDRVWPLQRPAAPPALQLAAPAPALALPALAGDLKAMQARLLALVPPSVPGRATVRRVLEVTAAHFDLTVEALLSDSRGKSLCHRRQIAMWVARRLTGRSLPFIARHIGGRDHTTILHGHRAVTALIEAGDAGTIEDVNVIAGKLVGGAHV
jgi:Bacterial dnaA protein helix-turn-helix